MITVVGVFNPDDVATTILSLYQHGFDRNDVTLIDRERIVYAPAPGHPGYVGRTRDTTPDIGQAGGARNATDNSGVSRLYSAYGFATSSANLQGIFSDLDIPEEASGRYRIAIRQGSALVLVRTTDEQASSARSLLEQSNGESITMLSS